MSLIYTSFKKRKRNKLPLTPELLEARRKHRKYLISLGIDPDRKISKRNFRVIPNWWEVGKTIVTETVKHSISTDFSVGINTLTNQKFSMFGSCL